MGTIYILVVEKDALRKYFLPLCHADDGFSSLYNLGTFLDLIIN